MLKKLFTAILLMATVSFTMTSCSDKKSDEAKDGENMIENMDELSNEELMKAVASKLDECSTPLEFMTCYVELMEQCKTRDQKEAVEDGSRLSKNNDKFDPSEIDEAEYKKLLERIEKAKERIRKNK